MINQITSTETSKSSVIVTNTLQEKNNNAEVILPVQSTPPIIALDYQNEVAPNAGLIATNQNYQPPSTSDAEPPHPSPGNHSPSESTAFDQYFSDTSGDSSFHGSCPTLAAHCGWLCKILDSTYSIPFWLLLMSAPVSAAVIGALYMDSSPGATHLAILIFLMGLLYSVSFLIKICSILFKQIEEESCKPSLRVIFGTMAIITIGLSITESAYFWQMKPSQEPGTPTYCDPQLMNYAFWWNCFMWFGILILFFCQS